MNNQDLYEKMKEQDFSAYNHYYEKYGWELHNYLQQRCPDKDLAAKVFTQAMSGFWEELSKNGSSDVMEAMLCLYADGICRRLEGKEQTLPAAPVMRQEADIPAALPDNAQALFAELSKTTAQAEPEAPVSTKTPFFPEDDIYDLLSEPTLSAADAEREWRTEPDRKPGRFISILLIVLLVIGILAAVWIVIGLLSQRHIIPGFYLDLGYTWFNRNIFSLF